MVHALRPAASAAAQHAPAKKAAGAAQTVEAEGGADGSALVLPELFASAAEAGRPLSLPHGRPELRAGAKLRFAGFREGLAGALQRVDAAGYATLVEAAAGA